MRPPDQALVSARNKMRLKRGFGKFLRDPGGTVETYESRRFNRYYERN